MYCEITSHRFVQFCHTYLILMDPRTVNTLSGNCTLGFGGMQDTKESDFVVCKTQKSATQLCGGHIGVHVQLSGVQDTEECNSAVWRTHRSATQRRAGHRRVQLSGVQDKEECNLAVCRTQKSTT